MNDEYGNPFEQFLQADYMSFGSDPEQASFGGPYPQMFNLQDDMLALDIPQDRILEDHILDASSSGSPIPNTVSGSVSTASSPLDGSESSYQDYFSQQQLSPPSSFEVAPVPQVQQLPASLQQEAPSASDVANSLKPRGKGVLRRVLHRNVLRNRPQVRSEKSRPQMKTLRKKSSVCLK